MVSRRKFLKIVGSSAVVFAAGGCSVEPTKAWAPWSQAGLGYKDPVMRALSYAILAPNPHNRQPWMVDLSEPDRVHLYCDLDRLLPETDPFNRQITIGLGCFLETLSIAASNDGYAVQIEPFPQGMPDDRLDGRPIASVMFQADQAMETDSLYTQILKRHSNKEPYDTERVVSETDLATLVREARPGVHVDYSADETSVDRLRELTWAAHLVETNTPRTFQESIDLMRIGKKEVEASPDGIDLTGTFMEVMSRTGLMTRETLADPNSIAFKQGLAMFEPIMKSAMAHLWCSTEDNTRATQIEVGRTWVRINLRATELGLDIHPLSQSLQEFDEMNELYADIHSSLVEDGRRVQMLGRLGYGPEASPSPRWALENKIL